MLKIKLSNIKGRITRIELVHSKPQSDTLPFKLYPRVKQKCICRGQDSNLRSVRNKFTAYLL